jgi:hypothetical protein
MTWPCFEETIVRPHGTYTLARLLLCLHESGSDLYTPFRSRAACSVQRHVNFEKWLVYICLQLLFIGVWIIQVARRVVVAYAFPFNANISPTSQFKHIWKHCLIENVLHLTYEVAFVNVHTYCAVYSATYCISSL